MSYYCCDKCDMKIDKLKCHRCNAELKGKTIEKNGQQCSVAECPECHGMVKAPQCCGTTMRSKS